MAFGLLSVFAVLAGALWLLRHSLKENSSAYEARHYYDNKQKFIDDYADMKLE